MRVLWFSNAPTDEAINHLGGKPLNIASWIISLHEEISIQPEIEMGFVFKYGSFNELEFRINQTDYFCVPNYFSSFERVINKFSHNVDSDRQLKIYNNIITNFKPDVIHIFGTENNYGLILNSTNIPTIIQMQGIISNYKLYYFQAISRISIFLKTSLLTHLKRSTPIDSYKKFQNQSIREIEILKKVKYIIGFTDFDRRISTLFNNPQYFKIPWLLRKPFNENIWNHPGGDKFLVSITINPNIYKGLETIYRISATLNFIHPGKFIFNIIGISRDSSLNYLIHKMLKKERLIFGEINFCGNLNAEQLMNELLKSHALLHPSLCDTSPNSICEAMILGMPVVATNVGGIPSLIEDRKTGFLVQSLDYLSMASILIELANNPELSKKIGKEARFYAKNKHEKGNIVKETIKAYNIAIHDSFISNNDKL